MKDPHAFRRTYKDLEALIGAQCAFLMKPQLLTQTAWGAVCLMVSMPGIENTHPAIGISCNTLFNSCAPKSEASMEIIRLRKRRPP